MKSFIKLGLIFIIISGCNTADQNDQLNNNESNMDTLEKEEYSSTFDRLKFGKDRFIVVNNYDVRIFVPYNKTQRVSARAVFDTETDVLEISSRESGTPVHKEQFKIESLIESNDIFESFKIKSLESEKSVTLVLVENGLILGTYPADINEVWIVYADYDNQRQVGEDFGHYWNSIEDISFEVK